MKIVKLGRIERSLLDRVINGDDIGALTANHRRSLSSLESKGLIEVRDGRYTATALVDQIALTSKDKNKVRNENRIAHIFGKFQGTNATYIYQARKIKNGYGGDSLYEAVASGTMTLKQAISIQDEVGCWAKIMEGEMTECGDFSPEQIDAMAEKLIQEILKES